MVASDCFVCGFLQVFVFGQIVFTPCFVQLYLQASLGYVKFGML